MWCIAHDGVHGGAGVGREGLPTNRVPGTRMCTMHGALDMMAYTGVREGKGGVGPLHNAGMIKIVLSYMATLAWLVARFKSSSWN